MIEELFIILEPFLVRIIHIFFTMGNFSTPHVSSHLPPTEGLYCHTTPRKRGSELGCVMQYVRLGSQCALSAILGSAQVYNRPLTTHYCFSLHSNTSLVSTTNI